MPDVEEERVLYIKKLGQVEAHLDTMLYSLSQVESLYHAATGEFLSVESLNTIETIVDTIYTSVREHIKELS